MRAEDAAREVAGLEGNGPWLAALTHPDALRRQHRPDHLTASAVVLEPTGRHVLLVLHRKVGLWLQPGGHVEDDDGTLAAAALREATEETGVPGLVVDDRPCDLDRHPAPCGARDNLDVRYLVRACAASRPVASEESLAVRWWPVDALPVQRVDLASLVRAGVAALGRGSQRSDGA